MAGEDDGGYKKVTNREKLRTKGGFEKVTTLFYMHYMQQGSKT
jgi:hypothetical protein